ncbi:hypothetical protein ACFTRD_25695 [Paenibacillus sp. NPDC056933]
MFNNFFKELREVKATLDNFDVLDESVEQMAETWKRGNDDRS